VPIAGFDARTVTPVAGPASMLLRTPLTRFCCSPVTMTQTIPFRVADVVNADRQLGSPLTRVRAYRLAAIDPTLEAELALSEPR
jgi:hypothetical protein